MDNSFSLIFKYVISLLLAGQSRAYQTSFYQEKDNVRLVADSFFFSFFFFHISTLKWFSVFAFEV